MWLNITPREMVEVVILPVFEVPVLVKKWDGMRITFLFFEISRYFPYKKCLLLSRASCSEKDFGLFFVFAEIWLFKVAKTLVKKWDACEFNEFLRRTF